MQPLLWHWRQCRPAFELDVEIALVMAALLIRGLGPVRGPFSSLTLHVDNPMTCSGGRKQTTGRRLLQTPAAPWERALGSLAPRHKCCDHQLPTADLLHNPGFPNFPWSCFNVCSQDAAFEDVWMCVLPLPGMEGAPINSTPDLSSSSGDQHHRAGGLILRTKHFRNYSKDKLH